MKLSGHETRNVVAAITLGVTETYRGELRDGLGTQERTLSSSLALAGGEKTRNH